MPKLPILTIPHPLLKQQSKPVDNFTPEIDTLICGLIETVKAHHGCVGIAAPQTGNLLRVVVIDASRARKPQQNHGQIVLVNPRIQHAEGAKPGREGCLSIPDLTANVTRAESVEVHAFDCHGKPFTLQATGFEAVVLQHEIDHLDGLLFLDRVTSLNTDVFRRKNT